MDVAAEAPFAPALSIAGAHEQAVRPRLPAVRVAQTGQIAPRLQECLLRRVTSDLGIARDAVCHPVEAVDRTSRERGERIAIALGRSLDECPLHRPIPTSGGSVPPLTEYGRRRPQNVHGRTIDSTCGERSGARHAHTG